MKTGNQEPENEKQSKISKNKTRLIFIISGLILISICVLSMCLVTFWQMFSSQIAFYSPAFAESRTPMETFCNLSSTDLKNFYDKSTTQSFKESTTFPEFQSYYKQNKNVLTDCSSFSKDNYILNLMNGVEVAYSQGYGNEYGQAIVIDYPAQGRRVVIVVIKEVDSWKFELINAYERTY